MDTSRHAIGDKVVALETYNNRSSTIIKGTVYSVKQVTFCPRCGEQGICVGFNTTAVAYNCINGHKIPKPESNSFFSSIRFANIDNLDAAISQAVEEENYQLAQILTNVQNHIYELQKLNTKRGKI